MTLCARGGCTASADGKYCSRRCSAIARLCAGWRPQASILKPEVRARACRRGALACAAVQRRRRAKAMRERLRPLFDLPCFRGLEPEQLAAFMAVVARGYRIGKADGYQQGWHSKSTPRLKRQKGQAA